MKPSSFALALMALATLSVPARAATLANRWSFDADTTDSVGGNDGVLVGFASVAGGELVLGGGTGPDADSMAFSSTVDLAAAHGADGVSIEAWYTDTGSGNWSKLFAFGNGTGGQNIIFNIQQAGSGQGRIQYNGMAPEANFGPQPAQNVEHHLALTISADGAVNAWIDGAAVAVQPPAETGQGAALSLLPSTYERIGASAWGDAGMTGSINEFRIWDGVLSEFEVGLSMASGPDALPDPEDTDGDALPDAWELSWDAIDSLDQLNGDDEGPGPGAGTGDFDGDGRTDFEEYDLDGTDPTLADTDSDGLDDGAEQQAGTDPRDPDSDDDGLLDGAEVNQHMTDPLLVDSDMDFFTDAEEVANGTNPNDPDDPGGFGDAQLAHRWSFTTGAELVDSIGGNSGVLVGDATVTGGQLVLDGAPNGPDADSMAFSQPVDLGGNFGASGASIEAWYTDSGSGSWSKLFAFGIGNSGNENLIFNLQQGATGEGRIQYKGMLPEANFGPQAAQGEEHYLALIVGPGGGVNAWLDGQQIQAQPPELTGDGDDLSTLPSAYERIGASAWGDAGMTGSVNEFRIWQGELTPAEVAANFASGPDALADEAGLAITEIVYDQGGGVVTITWNSVNGRLYAVDSADDLTNDLDTGWQEIDDGVVAEGDRTSFDDSPPAAAGRRFYRVRDVTP